MKILLADMERICKPCADRMKKKNLIAVQVEEGQIDKMLACKEIGKDEAWNLRKAMTEESMLKSAVIEKSGDQWCVFSEKKDKEGNRKKLGCYDSKEEAVKRLKQVEYFKHKKGQETDKNTIQPWMQEVIDAALRGNTESQKVLEQLWGKDWATLEKQFGKKEALLVEGFRGKSMFGIKDFKGEICPDCKKDILEAGKCVKCGYKTAQKEEGEWPGMPEGSKEKWDKYVERKEEGAPGAPPREQKSLPEGYKKPPMEPKQFTGEESVQRLFDRAEELTELVDKAQELADRAAERMARKKGLEENRAKLEDAWKQIRKIIKDQPGRISEFRDRIYYLFAQRMRGRPSYKEMLYGPPKEGQPGYDPGQEWQGIIDKFDDKEGTIATHVKSLHATIGAMKEVYEMYVAEKQTWKKGQVETVAAPVADEELLPTSEAEFIDQLTGYSYDILDIVSSADDVMYLLDFDISELEDSIGNNNQEEAPKAPEREPRPIVEPERELPEPVTTYNNNVVEDRGNAENAVDLPAAPKRR